MVSHILRNTEEDYSGVFSRVPRTKKDVLIGTLKKFSIGIRSTVPSNEQDTRVSKTNKKK